MRLKKGSVLVSNGLVRRTSRQTWKYYAAVHKAYIVDVYYVEGY